MRIALLVPGGVDRSGERRVIPALQALIGQLSRQDDVQVIALSQEAQPAQWEFAGARVHNIGTRRTRLRALLTIRALHRTAPFHIVQSIWSGSCGFIAVVAARSLGIPSLIHVAGGELATHPDINYGGALTRAGRIRERIVLRSASAVTTASAPIIDMLSAAGVAARRVPLGVDLDAWPVRPPVRRQGEKARLIHIASLNRVKDQDTLLRALGRLRDTGLRFEMDIVGEDTLGGEIQALAGSLGLSGQVRFRGFLTQRQLRPLVEAADLLLHSSRHETGPLAVLEAAVAGVPTVGTAVGHIAEWAPAAALSVPVGDWRALAEAARRLLTDEDARLAIAHEAQQRAIREDVVFSARVFRSIHSSLVTSRPYRTPA